MARARRRSVDRVGGCLSTLVAVSAVSPGAMAVTHTWSGGHFSGPNSMNNAFNWSGGIPVSSSANLGLVFPAAAGSTTPNQSIANPLVLQDLQTTGSYTFSGNGFQFANLGANPTLSATSGLVTFGTPVAFAGPTAVSLASGAVLQLNGLVTGAGAVNVTGTGTLSLNGGINTNTGPLSVSGSNVTVNMSAGQAIGGDLNASNGAIVQLLSPMQFGTATDAILDTSAVVTSSTNQQVRDLRVNNGASFSLTGSNTLQLTGVLSSTAGSGTVGQTSASVLDFGGATRVIDVQSTGAGDTLSVVSTITNGTFNKTGPGVLVLFNTGNSFTGTNLISAGTVRASTASIGSSLTNNGTLELTGGGTFNASIVGGSGQVVIPSFVTFNAAQTYTGGTDIVFGGAAFGEAATLAGDFTSSAGGGQLVFNQAANGAYAGNFGGALQVYKQLAGTLTLSGNSSHTGGTVLSSGGLELASDAALGAGPLHIFMGTAPSTVAAVGTRTIPNAINVQADFAVVGGGNVTFTDTSPKTLNYAMAHASTGSTTVDGKFTVGNLGAVVVNAGSLTLGDPAAVGGFNVIGAGAVTVNAGGTLTVRSLNFTSLSDVTLAGGTLNAPNGYAIPLGAALQGNGVVTGRVATANGSTILANGNLALGDAAHVAGVNLDGELYTNQFTVSLADANQAVLGSLTQLGNGATPGVLATPNGAVLNFGRNLAGYGQVQSANALAQAVIVNGDAGGNSFAQPLDFTGYVKGVGTFNFVTFSGTFAPGLSPALLTVGNVGQGPTSVLEIELGGLSRGGQYDAFDITGTYLLDGTLNVVLINAFVPGLGNQFDLFNGTTTGTFDTLILPPLSVGLIWDSSDLYTTGVLEVVAVPEPATTIALALGITAAVTGRRRRRA